MAILGFGTASVAEVPIHTFIIQKLLQYTAI